MSDHSAEMRPSLGRTERVLRLLRRHPTIAIGAAMLGLVMLVGLLAPVLGTIDPLALSPVNRLRKPNAVFWLGGDLIGRDVYSRTVYGARVSLIVGVSVAFASILLGLAVGLLSGFVRWVDAVAMRFMDGLMAIPSILLAVALIALTGASLKNVIVAITVSEVPRVARVVRSVVLSLKEQPFVEAAIALGAPFHVLLLRHVLPNAIAPLLVQGTYIFASAVLTESILSFIGAGTPPAIPSWGNIIAEGRTVFQIAPHIVLFPGLALAWTVLAVNLLGDGLRDGLDPRFGSRG